MTARRLATSVALKWLIDEPYSEQAARLLARDQPLVAPALIYAEAANALWALARRGVIGLADARDALDLLADAPLVVSQPMKQLMVPGARLARDLDHPVYDCIYLALALQEQRPVITAARRFQSAVHDYPFLSSHVVALQSLA